jgi:hypothetical protein
VPESIRKVTTSCCGSISKILRALNGTLQGKSVRKYRPQNDHVERSDLAKRFFIAGWERERAERAKREGERGRGLNTPQWDSA